MTPELVTLSKDQGGHILVVDDDPKNRCLLRDLLEARGHRISEAESGEEAMRIVVERQPDVVLLDVMMSGIDGFEVCRQIKDDPKTASIPVLLLTALTDRRHRIEGVEAGANDFLTKPIDTRDVVLRVRNAVHLKNIYDQLQANYDQLQDLETLRDNLTHLIIHDMKAPLAGISGYLELLTMQSEGHLSDKEQEYVAEAFEATQRLLRMTGALLDVSRLEAHEMPLQIEPCDLTEIARQAEKDIASLAQAKHIRITLPDEPALLSCDSNILRRVLTNLLENSVKYIPDNGLISLSVIDETTSLKMKLSDNGPGIPEEYQQKIFKKFGQVEIRREKKLFSTGLGLAFCKLAIQAHGGSIGVISPSILSPSEKNPGCTFWFSLPKKQSAKKNDPEDSDVLKQEMM